jgi:PP-loop superfamily ATP-utilizing enzyme
LSGKPAENLAKLVDWFLSNTDKALVALSGGVDSAVLALAAKTAFGSNA